MNSVSGCVDVVSHSTALEGMSQSGWASGREKRRYLRIRLAVCLACKEVLPPPQSLVCHLTKATANEQLWEKLGMSLVLGLALLQPFLLRPPVVNVVVVSSEIVLDALSAAA